MNKNLINDSYLFNNDLGFYLCSKKVEYDSNDIDYNNSSYTTLGNIIKQNKLNTSIGGLSQINHKLKYVIDNDKYKLKYNKFTLQFSITNFNQINTFSIFLVSNIDSSQANKKCLHISINNDLDNNQIINKITYIDNVNFDSSQEKSMFETNNDFNKNPICCPSVTISNNIINESDSNFINIVYDKNNYLNLYLNSNLIITCNIEEYSFKEILVNNTNKTVNEKALPIYLNECSYWHLEDFYNIPLWISMPVKMNYNQKLVNGIKFVSNFNKNISFTCFIKYHSDGLYYIINNKNEYCCLKNTNNNYPENSEINDFNSFDLNIEWIKYDSNEFIEISKNNVKRLLWKLFDTNNYNYELYVALLVMILHL